MDDISLTINDKYYMDAIAFWRCGKIAQCSNKRFDDETFLSSPIIYLFRHSAELLLKALIIRDAVKLYEGEINEVSFPPHNRTLISMHSLKALFETWDTLVSSILVTPIEEDVHTEVSNIIDRVNDCDPASTFFRYPYDRRGNENSRRFTTQVDEDLLLSVPCSIGAIMSHEDMQYFMCWHGEEQISWIEIDLDVLISKLNLFYTGMEL